MKVIILAAGKGDRLRPYTDNLPKCMVPMHGKPLLHYQLDSMAACGISSDQIAIVGGYLQTELKAPNIKQYTNKQFASTNMVETLFSARSFMKEDEDLIITYGDIVYQPEVLQNLIDTQGDIVISADKDWYKLWSMRMENPLDDAETFKVDEQNNIIELGKKPNSLDDVQAQYMGLIKISAKTMNQFTLFYQNLDRTKIYDGKTFLNMYMTSFIQELINAKYNVTPAYVYGGWAEVDTVEDLKTCEQIWPTKTPLVSVAIVTYNQRDFLKEAIDSVLAQDYANIEIIIADDGSTDDTHALATDYSVKYPDKFILRLSKENKGVTHNHNCAQFACSGKYIAWLGGDDLMLPGKISKQVSYMERHPNCDICYHDLDVFDSETGKTMYLYSQKSKPLNGTIQTLMKWGTFNGATSNMVRREKTPKEGFDVRIPISSDWLYWVEILAHGGTINYIPEVLGKYRRHQNNITNSNRFYNQCVIDHLNSCNILLARHPEYANSIVFRYHHTLKALRKFEGFKYKRLLFFGFQIRSLKVIVAGLIYFLSSGRKKL